MWRQRKPGTNRSFVLERDRDSSGFREALFPPPPPPAAAVICASTAPPPRKNQKMCRSNSGAATRSRTAAQTTRACGSVQGETCEKRLQRQHSALCQAPEITGQGGFKMRDVAPPRAATAACTRVTPSAWSLRIDGPSRFLFVPTHEVPPDRAALLLPEQPGDGEQVKRRARSLRAKLARYSKRMHRLPRT